MDFPELRLLEYLFQQLLILWPKKFKKKEISIKSLFNNVSYKLTSIRVRQPLQSKICKISN